MRKTKKIILIGIVSAVLLAGIVILALWFIPYHKIIKVPRTSDMAFISSENPLIQGPNTIFMDFEVDSNLDMPNGLYKGIAHSGQFAAKVFGKNSFSTSFTRKVSEIGMENLKSVGVSAWVYVMNAGNEPYGTLVFSITNSVGVNKIWKGIGLSGPLVPHEQWIKISGSWDLSEAEMNPDDQVQIYFWNNSATDILLDDLFVVFRPSADRIGDSSLTDMTRGGYLPRFNYPPFPVRIVNLIGIHREKPDCLTANNNPGSGKITPDDQVFSGHFLTKPGETESMLVIKPDGTPEMYHFCPTTHSFTQISFKDQQEILPLLAGFFLTTGNFSSPHVTQLLSIGEHGILLAEAEPVSPDCSGETASATKWVHRWKNPRSQIAWVKIDAATTVVSGDFTGDNLSELLLLDQNAWTLLKFSSSGPDQGNWEVIAQGNPEEVPLWKPDRGSMTLFPGKFFPGIQKDQILTVCQADSDRSCSYSLSRFSSSDNRFLSVFPNDQNGLGKTIGLDTLKPADRFLTGKFLSKNTTEVLRYHREWRFDLKVIRFNDSTYQVIENIDFSGYEKDLNPKYYEILKIFSGNWINPEKTDLLVIARNCKDPDYTGQACKEYENLHGLPDMLQIYSFQKSQKP